jgi:hypothetical protein
MGLFKPDPPDYPDPIDPGQSAIEYLESMSDPSLQAKLFAARETYDPQYAALEMQNIRNVMLGTPQEDIANPALAHYDSRIAELEDALATTTDENFFTKAERFVTDFVGAQSSQDLTREQVQARIDQLKSERAALPETVTRRGGDGLFDLLEEASGRSFTLQQDQLGQQREADVAALLGFAPQIVEGYRKADPYSAGTADLQREMATDLYGKAKGLTAQEERVASQRAREGAGARGRQFGEGALLAEALGRDEFLAGKRQQAQQAGQVAFGMDRTIAGDLGSVILGRPSSAMGMGQQMLGQATGMAPQMGSGGVFDIGTGVNLGLMNQQNSANYNANVYGAQAAAAGSTWGGLFGGLGALGGGIGGGLIAKCWVAREVYGAENDKWLLFRMWLESCAPKWFHDLYVKHGPAFAKWISNKPLIKKAIRKWMDGRIQSLERKVSYGYDVTN